MELEFKGKDIYKDIASQQLGIPYDQVTDEQRRLMKSKFWTLPYDAMNFIKDEGEINGI